MPLSDTAIRAAKPGSKIYKLSDGAGLQLHVTPHGSRLWRLAYRFGGKQRELSIGTYPSVSLAEARAAREEAKRKIREGVDPSKAKREARQALAASATFQEVAEEYQAKMAREGKADQTRSKAKWILDDLIGVHLGKRPVGEITPLDLLDVLRRIEARGHYETAARARRMCGQVFRFAIATGRAGRDPAQDLRGALTAPKYQPRAAILDDKGIGALMRAIDGYQGQGITHLALRFAPLVFVRPAELRHAEWGEIDFDEALWRIPAPKMKMRRDHIVPLSKQAVVLLRTIRPATEHSNFVFPSAWGSKKPISENTLNGALRRLGYGKEEMCAHGFRRMASTQLHEKGFATEWIERQLAHVDSNAIRGIYNAAQYLEGRREMMQWWADRLDALKGATSTNS